MVNVIDEVKSIRNVIIWKVTVVLRVRDFKNLKCNGNGLKSDRFFLNIEKKIHTLKILMLLVAKIKKSPPCMPVYKKCTVIIFLHQT